MNILSNKSFQELLETKKEYEAVVAFIRSKREEIGCKGISSIEAASDFNIPYESFGNYICGIVEECIKLSNEK